MNQYLITADGRYLPINTSAADIYMRANRLLNEKKLIDRYGICELCHRFLVEDGTTVCVQRVVSCEMQQATMTEFLRELES